MDTTSQLIQLCLTWRELIATKDAQYSELSTPAERLIPAMTLIDLRIELSLMEDELCTLLFIPDHVLHHQP